jgi:hypothetical protein
MIVLKNSIVNNIEKATVPVPNFLQFKKDAVRKEIKEEDTQTPIKISDIFVFEQRFKDKPYNVCDIDGAEYLSVYNRDDQTVMIFDGEGNGATICGNPVDVTRSHFSQRSFNKSKEYVGVNTEVYQVEMDETSNLDGFLRRIDAHDMDIPREIHSYLYDAKLPSKTQQVYGLKYEKEVDCFSGAQARDESETIELGKLLEIANKLENENAPLRENIVNFCKNRQPNKKEMKKLFGTIDETEMEK